MIGVVLLPYIVLKFGEKLSGSCYSTHFGIHLARDLQVVSYFQVAHKSRCLLFGVLVNESGHFQSLTRRLGGRGE